MKSPASTQRRPVRHRRGIATFFAVAALGLVATAALAMSTMLRIEHRRTNNVLVDAQLRQLLLAGADSAADFAHPELPELKWRLVALPEAFAERGGSAKWCRVEPTGVESAPFTVMIVAEYSGKVARQRVVLRGDWDQAPLRPVSAEWLP